MLRYAGGFTGGCVANTRKEVDVCAICQNDLISVALRFPEFQLLSISSLGTIVQKISASVAELIRPLVYADIDAHTSILQTTESPIVQTIITPEVDSTPRNLTLQLVVGESLKRKIT